MMQQQTTQDEQETNPQPLTQPAQATQSSFAPASAMSALDAEAAQQFVAGLTRQSRRRWRTNFAVGLSILPLLVLMVTFTPQISIPAIFAVYSVVIVMSLWLYLHTWLQIRHARKVLANVNDVRLIGPLVQAWDAERFLKPKPVIDALRRLLPRMQASDAHLLTSEQRTYLYRAINWQSQRNFYLYDRGLTVDILKALQQIGGKDALPYVQRAAKWSRHADVRHAANDCLPFLLAQAEEYKRGEHLLRPADARTSAPDVLLRPSFGNGELQTPPDQLLRPQEVADNSTSRLPVE